MSDEIKKEDIQGPEKVEADSTSSEVIEEATPSGLTPDEAESSTENEQSPQAKLYCQVMGEEIPQTLKDKLQGDNVEFGADKKEQQACIIVSIPNEDKEGLLANLQENEKSLVLLPNQEIFPEPSSNQCVLPVSWLEDDLTFNLIVKFIKGQSTLHAEDVIGRYFNQLMSFKVSTYFRVGYYSDIMFAEAAPLGFNTLAIRDLFNRLIFHLNSRKLDGEIGFPFEFKYGVNEQQFFCSLFCDTHDEFELTKLHDFRTEMKELGIELDKNGVYLDLNFIKQSLKLVINIYWHKSRLKQAGLGLNIYQVDKANIPNSDESEKVKILQVEKDLSQDDSLYSLDLPSTGNNGSILEGDPVLLEALVLHLIVKKENDEIEKEFSEFERKDVEQNLADFEDEEVVFGLIDPDYRLIITYLQNEDKMALLAEKLKSLGEGEDKINLGSEEVVQAVISKVKGVMEEEEEIAFLLSDDPEDEDVQRISGGPGEDELSQLVSGGDLGEDDLETRIKGEKEEYKDELTRISGGPNKNDKGAFAFKSLGGGEKASSGMFNFDKVQLKNGGSASLDKKSLFKIGNKIAESKTAGEGGPVDTKKSLESELNNLFDDDIEISEEELAAFEAEYDKLNKLKKKSVTGGALNKNQLNYINENIAKELRLVSHDTNLGELADKLSPKLAEEIEASEQAVRKVVEKAIKLTQKEMAKMNVAKSANNAMTATGELSTAAKVKIEGIQRTNASEVKRLNKIISSLRDEVEGLQKKREEDRKSAQSKSQVKNEELDNLKKELIDSKAKFKSDLDEIKKLGGGPEGADTSKIQELFEKKLQENGAALLKAKHSILEAKREEHNTQIKLKAEESKVTQLQADVRNRETQVTMLKKNFEKLKDIKDKKIDDLTNKLEGANSKAESDRSNMEEKLKNIHQKKALDLQGQIDSLKGELARKTKELGKANSGSGEDQSKIIKRLEDQTKMALERATKEKQLLEKKAQDANNKTNEMRKDIIKAQSELKTVRADLTKKMMAIQEQLDAEKKKSASGDRPKAASNGETPKNNQEIGRLKDENSKLEEKIKAMTKNVNDANANVKSYTLKIKELEHKLKLLSGKNNPSADSGSQKKAAPDPAVKAEMKALEIKAKNAEKQVVRLSDSVKKLTTELTEAKKQSAKFKQEATAKKNEVEALKRDLAKTKKGAA